MALLNCGREIFTRHDGADMLIADDDRRPGGGGGGGLRVEPRPLGTGGGISLPGPHLELVMAC